MAIVLLDMAMSLDGFIGGVNGEDRGLYDWYFAPSANSAKVIAELIENLGAIIMGRRAYETGDEAGGYEDNPYHAAHFVVTHTVPAKQPGGQNPFTFVTDGIDSALVQAKAAAGDRAVAIAGGANIAQQYLKAGLVDEVQIHLVSVLLGQGIRLFETLGAEPIDLEKFRVVEGVGVTHLKYRVVK